MHMYVKFYVLSYLKKIITTHWLIKMFPHKKEHDHDQYILVCWKAMGVQRKTCSGHSGLVVQ